MNIYEGIFSTVKRNVNRYSLVLEDIEESGIEWRVMFQFNSETDDSFESSEEEVTVTAPDAPTACKYAEQYARKMQKESQDSKWETAEIVSVDKL